MLKKLVVLSITIATMGYIYANPVGGEVTAGSATITQTPGNTQINQTSQQAIINWHSFNIAPGEKTQFVQPNADAIVLNRIDPNQGASQIFGQLTANGRVILVNQAGLFFASGAHVDVGSLIASTSDISDQNFLAGKYIFDKPSQFHGSVINEGTIIAANNGLVALIGANVSNSGVIQANVGRVVLASGNKFTVDLTGDGLINFAVDEESTVVGRDQNGNDMTDGVKNTGSLIANGGKILLTAKNAQGIVDKAINMSGVAQAQSVSEYNGEIIFSAEGSGNNIIHISGAFLDASGKFGGGKGGTVKILGSKILLDNSTQIDVSGDAGGGTILVGGNFHGVGPEQNALMTVIDSTVALNANALTNGNGGQIAIWSDLYTRFDGSASAQGGVFGGDGGFVETSSHGLLSIGSTAQAHLLALMGSSGTWLLDPLDIVISNSADNDVNASSPFEPTGTASNLNVSTILSALQSGNVVVQTTGTVGAQNGDITVNNSIVLPGGGIGSLTLNAAGNVLLNASIVMGNASNQNTNLNINAAGSISDGAAIALGGYNITLNAANINLTQAGTLVQAFGSLAQGGGTLTMTATGSGASALNLGSINLDTTSASIVGTTILQATDANGGIEMNGTAICTIGNACNLNITTPNLAIGANGLTFNTSNGTQSLTLSGAAPIVNLSGVINTAPTTGFDSITSPSTVTVNVISPGSLGEATEIMTNGGSLNVVSGTYNEALTISQPTALAAIGGTVTLNSLTINNTLSGLAGTWSTQNDGDITINNAVTLSNATTLQTTGLGNITLSSSGSILWPAASEHILSLTSANYIYLDGAISGGAAVGAAGSLNLSAANINQSITGVGSPATGVASTIDIANFNLLQGQWYQNNPSLPAFAVSNNFRIQSGAITPTAAEFLRVAGGNGAGKNEFVITDIYGLQGMNSANTSGNNLLSLYFQLANNIDASSTANWNNGEGFRPIGSNGASFTGGLVGNNFAIDSLHINAPSNDYVGLFGVASGFIGDVGVTNANIIGGQNVGGIAGIFNTGVISGVYATGNVTQTTTASSYGVGGLVGQLLSGNIEKSYTNVNVNGIASVGGLVGFQDNSTISFSFSTGNVYGSCCAVGGLVGFLASGGAINDSYSMANVRAVTSDVGGLVGYTNAGAGAIVNTFSTGYVSPVTNSGGLIGRSEDPGVASTSYYDMQTSGMSNSASGVGLTTAQLQSGLPTGFNPGTWGIIAGDGAAANGSYAYLVDIFSNTPRIISGYAPGGSASAAGLNGSTVNLAYGGNVISTVTTGANGFYYFLLPNGTIAGSDPFLVYLSGGSTAANVVGVAPADGASAVLLNMAANTVNVYGYGTSGISSLDLGTAAGLTPTTDVLFSVSGANLELGNAINKIVNLVTNTATSNFEGTISTGSTTYTINGDISTVSGGTTSVNFSGPVNIYGNVTTSGSQTYSQAMTLGGSVTLAITGTGNMTLGDLVTAGGNNLTLSSGNTSNTLTLLGGNQNWYVNVANSGRVDGVMDSGILSFNGFGNLTGGSGNNNFEFADGASIAGAIDGGSGTSRLYFNSSTSPLTAVMSSLDTNTGSVINGSSQTITGYSNIGTVEGVSTLQTANKVNAVTITGNGEGSVNDPLFFTGVTTLNGQGSTTINFGGLSVVVNTTTGVVTFSDGSTMTFLNIPAGGFTGSGVTFAGSTTTTTSSGSSTTTTTLTPGQQSGIYQIAGQTTQSSYSTNSQSQSSSNQSQAQSDSTSSGGDSSDNVVMNVPAAYVNQSLININQAQRQLDISQSSSLKISTAGACGL